VRYIDVCSGISAPTAAWKPLGWQALCYAEIEAAPRAVLAHHYPDTPLRGDFTEIRGDEYGAVDLLVGGTPCQSFSVAGLRGGLADERGNLALEYLRLADRARPRWLVWENVPGVLSSNGGRDFGTFLGGLAQLGYGFAYAVLDAQHFGIPQRRRRVFVVGYLGDWRRAAAVLFERHSLSGDSPPRREKGQVAPTVPSRSSAGGGLGTDFDCDGGLIAFGSKEYAQDAGAVSPPLRAMGSRKDHPNGGGQIAVAFAHQGGGDQTTLGYDPSAGTAQTLGVGQTPAIAIQERAGCENPEAGPDGVGFRTDGQAYTLEARTVPQAVAFGIRSDASRSGEAKTPSADAEGRVRLRNPGMGVYQELAPTVDASQAHSVAHSSAVRRLTPRECERLQGFPDDFTLVPCRKGMMADGPRYKMLGNSMAVPVVRWIGERIAAVEAIEQAERDAA
jgi:DNA (cytosine-5)-methyltransferase 1